MKLWKVVINNWGWEGPRTRYARSREEAEQIGAAHPAADPVEYAGDFTEANARRLLGEDDEE